MKGNLLKRHRKLDYEGLSRQIGRWLEEVCNSSKHGTTKRIPAEVFEAREKPAMHPLPGQRFEVWQINTITVHQAAHMCYRTNYHSVPTQLAGKRLTVRCNGTVLLIAEGWQLIAQHLLHHGRGQYISKAAHRPSHKRHRSKAWYDQRAKHIGPQAVAFLEALKTAQPHHWHARFHGIMRLTQHYARQDVDRACGRAPRFEQISYRVVRRICEQRLYDVQDLPQALPALGGSGHQLANYDRITQS